MSWPLGSEEGDAYDGHAAAVALCDPICYGIADALSTPVPTARPQKQQHSVPQHSVPPSFSAPRGKKGQ